MGVVQCPAEPLWRRRASSWQGCTATPLLTIGNGSTVAEDGDAPAWSPDANLLYFWSSRDGSPCLWAQRLDPLTKTAERIATGDPAFSQPRALVAQPVSRCT